MHQLESYSSRSHHHLTDFPARLQALIFCEDDYLRQKRQLTRIPDSSKHPVLAIWKLSSRVYDMGRSIDRHMTALRDNFEAFDTAFASLYFTDPNKSQSDDLQNSIAETLQIYADIKQGLGQLIKRYSTSLKGILKDLTRIYNSSEKALAAARNDQAAGQPYEEFFKHMKQLSLCRAEAYASLVKTVDFLKTIRIIKVKLD